MESLTEQNKAGLNLNESNLDTNSSPASPSPEAVPDDLEERSGTCSQEPNQVFLDETWKKFIQFMDAQAAAEPYPKFLYRAHVHGYPLPRSTDKCTNKYADAFSSDFHARAMDETRYEFDGLVSPSYSIIDVFEDLNRHLGKSQIGLNDSKYLSRMVSLSEDLVWTTHRLCVVRKLANQDQLLGLAIFDVERIRQNVQIWRVRDMLRFLDASKELRAAMGQNPIRVPKNVKKWPRNAKEYVCWKYVPRTALLSFAKLSDLISSGLLNLNFTSSINLERYRREEIKPDRYKARASAFLRAAVINPLCLERVDAESMANQLAHSLFNDWAWGYQVSGFAEDMDDLVDGLRDDLKRQIRQKCFLLMLHRKSLLLDYELALKQIW